MKKTVIEKDISSNTKKEKDYKVLILGTDERNQEKSRSDVILLLNYNSAEKKLQIISIPRDSRVEIPNKGLDKVNAAYAYGGGKLAVETVENLLETEIDGYIKINFKGFYEIIKLLDGVEVEVKKSIDWYDHDLNKQFHINKGLQRLKYDDLLTYVRYRGDSQGDYGRVQRQQEVIVSILKETLNKKNLTKIPDLIKIGFNNIETDLELNYFIYASTEILKLKNFSIEQNTLSITGKIINGIWYGIIDDNSLNNIKNNLKK